MNDQLLKAARQVLAALDGEYPREDVPLGHVRTLAEAVLASAPQQAQETSLPPQGADKRVCSNCNGSGVVGIPGAPCPFCKLESLAWQWEPSPDEALAEYDAALAASTAPAPQEPAARFLLVAMDDDGCGNPVFCADEKAVRAALAPLLFFFNDEHPLSAEHDAEVDAQLEALLEDGFLRFEGDPGINLYKLHAHLYASPAPGELGAASAWQPIETAPWQQPALLYAPPEALYIDSVGKRGEYRVNSRQNWTWATHWMPLPQPPQQAPSESSAQGAGGEKV